MNKSIERIVDEAANYYYSGEIERGIGVLQLGVSQNPKSLTLKLNLANFYILSFQNDKAIKFSQRLVEDFPSDGLSHLTLGDAYRQSQQFSKAKASYINALINNADFKDTFTRLGYLEYEKGNLITSFNHHKTVEKVSPDSQTAYDLGQICLINNHPKWAQKLFETSIQRDKQNLESVLGLAHSYLAQRKISDYLLYFNYYFYNSSTIEIPIITNHIQDLGENGYFDLAKQELNIVLNTVEDLSDNIITLFYQKLANVMIAKSTQDDSNVSTQFIDKEVRDLYESGIKRFPKNPLLYAAYSDLETQLSNHSKALELIDKSISLLYSERQRFKSPRLQMAEILSAKGFSLMCINDFDKAKQVLEKTIKFYPNPRAFANLAILAIINGENEKAIEYGVTALRNEDIDESTAKILIGDLSEIGYKIKN